MSIPSAKDTHKHLFSGWPLCVGGVVVAGGVSACRLTSLPKQKSTLNVLCKAAAAAKKCVPHEKYTCGTCRLSTSQHDAGRRSGEGGLRAGGC